MDMGISRRVGNAFIKYGRLIARSDGTELAVFVDDHSIKTKMVDVNSDNLAWDGNLYKRGCLFYGSYANPIKPTVDHNKELEEHDEIDVEEGGAGDDGNHTAIISSSRFQSYMRQHLISQLLNPRDQWRVIVYAVLALAGLMLVNVLLTASSAGLI